MGKEVQCISGGGREEHYGEISPSGVSTLSVVLWLAWRGNGNVGIEWRQVLRNGWRFDIENEV